MLFELNWPIAQSQGISAEILALRNDANTKHEQWCRGQDDLKEQLSEILRLLQSTSSENSRPGKCDATVPIALL